MPERLSERGVSRPPRVEELCCSSGNRDESTRTARSRWLIGDQCPTDASEKPGSFTHFRLPIASTDIHSYRGRRSTATGSGGGLDWLQRRDRDPPVFDLGDCTAARDRLMAEHLASSAWAPLCWSEVSRASSEQLAPVLHIQVFSL